ncbi:MAG: type II toxin-antitoxin system RelE/ParE family toxin [Xanthomonadales bacterium]|nr:type II toxin-antitoxin system RelE/ParE family toxin [Xanthomonadales bacterium]
MIRAKFHPDALAEFEDAANYYELLQPGLSARFVANVESALQSVSEAPEVWPVLVTGVRRRLIRVFPYALLYSVESDHVLVLAVMHCHQEPGYWLARASGAQLINQADR